MRGNLQAVLQRPMRPVLAGVAAVVAVLIARHQHHVHIVWNDPLTYTQPLIHRCGIVLYTSLAWATGEAVLWLARVRPAAPSRLRRA